VLAVSSSLCPHCFQTRGDNLLRDAAQSWVRTHVRDPKFHIEFLNHFDRSADQGRQSFVAVSAGLTTDQQPWLIHCFCNNLFLFQLSPSQAQSYDLGPNEAMWGNTGGVIPPQPPEPLPVAIGPVTVELADDLPVDHPLVAGIEFDTNGHEVGPCVVRFDYEVPGQRNCVAWFYIDFLRSGRGRINSQFLALRKPQADLKPSGPIALFFRLCTLPDPKVVENRTPISNIVSVLVTPKL
jgi:hypothetical protein